MKQEKMKEILQQQYENLQTSVTRAKNFTYTMDYANMSAGQRYLFAKQYKLEMELLDIIEARLSLL